MVEELSVGRDDPLDVGKAIRISDTMLVKIKQNLVWTVGNNMAMTPLLD